MRTYLVAFGLSLIVSFVLTRIVRNLARRFGWHDKGGGRKIHTQPIPRLGGIAVAISAIFPLLGMFLWDNKISREFLADRPLLLSLLGGSAIILLVGVIDDIKGSRAWVKLLGQLAAALVVFYSGIRIEAISIPFWAPVHFGILSLPVTLFWMVLVMNAINLIDGLDGLAGGVVVLAGSTLFAMSVVEDNALAALLLAVIVGGTAGFLPYNVNRATIFLGDTGSLWLGFILALVSVHSSQKSYALFSIVAALLALGLPIFDLSMAVVRRYLSGQPIFAADQNHVHHILLRKGLSQSQSVVLLFGAAILLEGMALVFIYADDAISAVAIAALVPMIVIAVKLLGYGDLIKHARRARAMEGLASQAQERSDRLHLCRERLLQARSVDDVWEQVQTCCHDLGFERVALDVMGGGAPLEWSASRPGTVEKVHHQSLRQDDLVLRVGGGTVGRMRLASWRERDVFSPHDEALIALLADGVTLALVGIVQTAPLSGRDVIEAVSDAS